MKASLSTQVYGSRTEIFAAVFANGNVELGCGDVLSVTIGGQRTVLAREADPGSGPIHYTATITSSPTDAVATIAFERPSPKVSAPLSKMYLPTTFAVRDVAPTVKISSSENVRFRLDPPIKADVQDVKPDSVQLKLDLDGACLEPVRFTWSKSGVLFPPQVNADGTVAIVKSGQFLKRKGDQPSCDVALLVTTFTAGELDGAFAGPLEGGLPAEGSRHEDATFHLEW